MITKLEKGELNLNPNLIEFFKEIFEKEANLNLGVAILLEKGFHYMNKRFTEIGGYSLEEIKSWNLKQIFSYIHKTDREKVIIEFKKKVNGSKEALTQYKFKILHKSGETIWVNIYSKRVIIDGQAGVFIALNKINVINTELQFKREFNPKELFGEQFTKLNQIYKTFNKDLLEDLKRMVINFIEVTLNEINQNL